MNKKKFLLILCLIIVAGSTVFYLKKSETDTKMKHIVADVSQELTQHPLMVQGKIPEWLNGTFVRNGPVSVKVNGEETPHWFDGLAMLQGFSFQKGQVLFSNKFLRTHAYQEIFEKGNLHFGGFASGSSRSFLEKLFSFFVSSKPELSNANVNVSEFANQTVALTETPMPVRFDLKTLDTLGGLEFQDDLPKKDMFESAHPQDDKIKSEKINYLIEYGKDSFYVVYRLAPDLNIPKREVIAKIPVERPAYMHSFALTKNKIIFVEFPFTVNPIDLILKNKGFIQNFTWQPEKGTRFIVVDRKTGQHTSYHFPEAFFAFHHVNAFESGESSESGGSESTKGDIIIDMVTYRDASVVTDLAKHGDLKTDVEAEKKLDAIDKTKFVRFILSQKNKTLASQVLLDHFIEFPRINENYNTQPYRYAYLADGRTPLKATDIRPLYKLDTQTKMVEQWTEPGLMPGEPVFIANPNGKDEEDGVIVTIVLDKNKNQSFLLMLDGKTFKEIARAYVPFVIPAGLHGQFFTY